MIDYLLVFAIGVGVGIALGFGVLRALYLNPVGDDTVEEARVRLVTEQVRREAEEETDGFRAGMEYAAERVRRELDL